MRHIPVGHRLLVELDAIESDLSVKDCEVTTASGFKLFLPKEATELKKDKQIDESAMDIGTIVSIGPRAWYGCHDGTPWATVGDKVLFNRYAGRQISDKESEERYRVIDDIDVLTIVKEDEND